MSTLLVVLGYTLTVLGVAGLVMAGIGLVRGRRAGSE